MNIFHKLLPALLVAFLFAMSNSAQADYSGPPIPIAPPIGPGPDGGGLFTGGLVPVCSGTRLETGVRTAGNSILGRGILSCGPTASLELGIGGTWQNTTTETDITAPVPMNIVAEPNLAPQWSPTTTYTAGQVVSWLSATSGGSSGAIEWTAAAGSTNSPPTVANSANWTPYNGRTVANGGLIIVTCNGKPTCGLLTQPTASGTVVTQGLFVTDPIYLNTCTTGCLIGFRAYKLAGPGQAEGYTSSPLPKTWGAGTTNSAGQADLTQSANVGNGVYNNVSLFAPILARGVPYGGGNAWTAGIFGDSIGFGSNGGGNVASNVAVNSGGSGFVAGDVGLVCTVGIAGGSSGAVNQPGTIEITSVSGGAVTGIALVYQGSYTDVTKQPSQTLPSTSQGTTCPGATGTGLTVTITYTGVGYDAGNSLAQIGYLSRAATESVRQVQNLAQGSDTCAGTQSRDYSRLNYFKNGGAANAFIEYGINDVNAGTSAATIEACLTNLANQAYANGAQRVYLVTMTPYTVSTDGFLTSGNQTVWNSGQNTVRVAVNTWERTVPAPFSGVIDAASCGETSLNSGIWKTDGVTVGLYSIDGLHPSGTGTPLLAACVKTLMASVVAMNDRPDASHYASNDNSAIHERKAA